MISKSRRNRISKTRRNRISKTKRISGGEKGDVHTWNLGICLIKQKEGRMIDDYWLEFPDDPLPDGWELVNEPNRYPMYKNLSGDKEIYPGIGNDKNLYMNNVYNKEKSNNTIYRPLLEPGNEKMTENEYIQKLQTTEWKKTKRYNYDINGLNDFIETAILVKDTWKILDNGNKITRPTKQPGTTYSKWRPRSGIYNLLINFNEAAVPEKFKKLYKTVRDWNLKAMKDWF